MSREVVFISDFLLEDIAGGGELVDDCLKEHLQRRGHHVTHYRCQDFTLETFENHQNNFFIVSNFVSLREEIKRELQKKQYAIFEHDHKYLTTRDPSKYDDYQAPPEHLINLAFYRSAAAIFCQSRLHTEILKKNIKFGNFINLGCALWSEEHLKALEENLNAKKDDNYAVLKSNNPTKGMPYALAYCEKENIKFDLISSDSYADFISQLASKEGLVFFSQVVESFCRLVVEARILGCKIKTNAFNGCASEEWFSSAKGEELLRIVVKKQSEIVDKVESVIIRQENNLDAFEDGKITVLLNSYRRPYNLKLQIEAIKKQTVKPHQIWLWVNAHEDNEDFDYSELGIDRIFNNDYNWKFYGRFAAALLADTEYVAIFDDDTVPGEKWFTNCLNTMNETPGILGSAGVILNNKFYVDHERCGWPTQNEETTEVDLVGHAWFFKREWLQYLWKEKPPTWDNAEDIQFSYAAQKYGNIKTYCPPHPRGDASLHGSTMGNELGIDAKATSTNQAVSHQQFFTERDCCLQSALKNGWKTVKEVKL